MNISWGMFGGKRKSSQRQFEKANTGKKIPRARKGDSPSLLDASYANKIIDSLNALQRMEIQEGENNEVNYSNENVVLKVAGGKTKGFSGTVFLTTEDIDSGALIPHTFIFEDGLLVQYDESS